MWDEVQSIFDCLYPTAPGLTKVLKTVAHTASVVPWSLPGSRDFIWRWLKSLLWPAKDCWKNWHRILSLGCLTLANQCLQIILEAYRRKKKKQTRKYGMQKATVKLCNKPPWTREFLWKVVTIKKSVCVMGEATLSHSIHAPDSPRPTATQPANCEGKLRTPSAEMNISSNRKSLTGNQLCRDIFCPEG